MLKTLLVGLDAACWEYLAPLLEAGRMPTLQGLIDSGSSGTLHSTMPPWTPTAWSSLITGKNPGNHGIFDMLSRKSGTYESQPTNATMRFGTPFWNRLNDKQIRVGLVNVPFTYPPRPVDGYLVGGFGTPPSVSNITYPEEVLDFIETKFGPYEPIVEPKFLRTASPEAILEKEKSHQTRQAQIAIELAKRDPVDVLVINLMLPDHANHKMPKMDLIQEAYIQSDLDLAYLIDSFQPDNIMVISDHGSSRLKGDFLFNAWLRDQGYLVQLRKNDKERSTSLNWILTQWLQVHHGVSGFPEKILRRLIRTSLFFLPGPLPERILDRIGEDIPFAKEHVLFSDEPDYSQTRVFPGSVYSGLLYLNVIGREPSGIIPPASRQALAEEIAGKLLEIREPESDRPLFSNVYTREEIYPGSTLPHTPDLVLDSYDKGWNIRASKYVPIPEPLMNNYFVDVINRGDYGWHSREGVMVFTGQSFLPGLTQIEGHLVDIPATLLHLHGVPVPEDYDGRVLQEVLQPEIKERVVLRQPGDSPDLPQDHEQDLSPDESEELVNHLRALGYLD